MLDEWQYSAEVLISHFRCVLHGQTPFSQDSEARKNSFKQLNLDTPSIEYLEKVITLLASKSECFPKVTCKSTSVKANSSWYTGKDFKDIKDSGSFKLDKRFVWLSQLFLRDEASKPHSKSENEIVKAPIKEGDYLAGWLLYFSASKKMWS